MQDDLKGKYASMWRPTLAYAYVLICVFDFVIAPIMTTTFYYITGGQLVPWKSLTMSEAGLFHVAMGAILGVAAWTRG